MEEAARATGRVVAKTQARAAKAFGLAPQPGPVEVALCIGGGHRAGEDKLPGFFHPAAGADGNTRDKCVKRIERKCRKKSGTASESRDGVKLVVSRRSCKDRQRLKSVVRCTVHQ